MVIALKNNDLEIALHRHLEELSSIRSKGTKNISAGIQSISPGPAPVLFPICRECSSAKCSMSKDGGTDLPRYGSFAEDLNSKNDRPSSCLSFNRAYQNYLPFFSGNRLWIERKEITITYRVQNLESDQSHALFHWRASSLSLSPFWMKAAKTAVDFEKEEGCGVPLLFTKPGWLIAPAADAILDHES